MRSFARMSICIFLVLMCLTACNKGDVAETEVTVDAVDTESTADAQAESLLNVVADGATEYVLLRPEDASQAVIEATMALHKAINETFGTQMKLTTDFEKRGFDVSTRYPFEIVVGHTNRDESAEAKELIRYNDAIIAVMGTRVVITGGSDEAVIHAVEHFIANYLTGTALQLHADLRDVVSSEYALSEPKLGGVGLSEYTLVYANGFRDAAAAMADRIGDACGVIMKTTDVKSEKGAYEIVIGSAERGSVKPAGGYDDFTVSVNGADLYVTGGSTASIGTGCARLLSLLLSGEKADYTLAEAAMSYTLPDRQDYIQDISKLALNWELYFDTPDWMLDYEEKYAAMFDPDGRLMSCLHRGDMQKYPENSIEGLISAVRMGADMVEIDPRRTKDGVLILLHDETLTRTTDVASKAGKNGLPTSHKVADWTYEQLQQLNLKEGTGGNNARLTEYKIPTLDEAFRVCANRLFIRLDVKADTTGVIFWNYERDIWPLMCKYESYTNVLYTWHAAFSGNGYALVKKYNAEQIRLCGQSAVHIRNGSAAANDILSALKSNPDVFDPVIRLTNFDLSDVSCSAYLKANEAKLSQLKGKVRIYVDAHGTNSSFSENTEGAALYEMLNDAGINVLLVNRGYNLCTYIAEHFEATAK